MNEPMMAVNQDRHGNARRSFAAPAPARETADIAAAESAPAWRMVLQRVRPA